MKKFLTTALASLALASLSQAADNTPVDFEVYVTGATAFRIQLHAVLSSKLTAIAPDPLFNGADNASRYTFQGTWTAVSSPANIANKKVRIYCAWNGSVEGQGSLLGITTPQNYRDLTFNFLTGGTFVHTAQLAFSDAKQSSGKYASLTPLVGSPVGI